MNSVERYYQRKRKRKKKAKVVFFSLLFVLMVITLAVLSMTVFFNAETIEVSGNTRYTVDELLSEGELKIGQNLFRLDKFEVIDRMKTLPYVKEVTIKRKLPNTLSITVEENQPVVWVPMGEYEAALLNEEYRVLEFVTLPQVLREEPEEEPEEEPAEEEAEETPAPASPIEGIPQLTQVTATELVVGETALFGEVDYTGFLQRLYEGFSARPELEWSSVTEVQFFARYDVKVLYKEHVTIDFGTLDQTDTKLQLAAYLLNENGTGQPSIVDVSDTERVYYRPAKEEEELPKEESTEEESNEE